jgi:DNA-directed RNA polymerase I subunit RPA2
VGLIVIISQGANENTFVTERVEAMLRKQKRFAVFTQNQCLAFLGAKFQPVLGLAESMGDIDVGKELLRKVLFVHLTNNSDKFELLVYVPCSPCRGCFMDSKFPHSPAGS